MRPLSGGSARAAALAVLATGALAGSGGEALAGPTDDLHVAVHAPLGKGCISGDKLRVAVQKHIGSGAQRRTVDVRIQTNEPEPGWVAEVAVTGRAGSRVVRTGSADCRQLDDGLVLVVTLLVDPEEDKPAPAPPAKGTPPPDSATEPAGGSSWGSGEPAEPAEKGGGAAPEEPGGGVDKEDPSAEGPGAEEPGAEEPAAEKGGVEPASDKRGAHKGDGEKGRAGKDAADGEAGPKGGKKGVQFGIGAGLTYTMGLVPGALPGARLGFEWMAPGPFPFEVSFTYNARWSEYRNDASVSWSRQVDSLMLDVQACPLGLSAGRLRLGACGGLALTYVEENFWGDDLTVPLDNPEYLGPTYIHQEQLMLSPTVELRVEVEVLSWLRARAGFGGPRITTEPRRSRSRHGVFLCFPVILQDPP